MPDPLAQQPPPPLFAVPNDTRLIALSRAARNVGNWRQRILDRLRVEPSTLFEVAAHYHVPEHTISGRFSELLSDGYIERTGERRIKPQTDCAADVWRIRRAILGTGADVESNSGEGIDLAQLGGYPLSMKIGNEIHERQELLPSESYPGFPYAPRADSGTHRKCVRVCLVECPACGKPLFFAGEKDGFKTVRCGNERCLKTFHPRFVSEPGKGAVLALVMETF